MTYKRKVNFTCYPTNYLTKSNNYRKPSNNKRTENKSVIPSIDEILGKPKSYDR